MLFPGWAEAIWRLRWTGAANERGQYQHVTVEEAQEEEAIEAGRREEVQQK